ncbi:hypothetical protein KTJ89_11345 [Brevibacterium sediminis]|uniref:hypothetical protein n=1 Tax=Brevibacterium sediminis TaxID=1857024 RepID=UPI0021755266|nr:hypothetical protein [Brevibacterium sediminis]MCS4593576.1 hypothetical protein [Brevibacterium sediminis]
MNWDEQLIETCTETDGKVHPRTDHVLTGAKWMRDQLRTDEAVERVALVLIEQRGYYIGEGWPTNEDLSGGPAGDRDVEFKSAWMDSAREVITALLGED